MKKIILEFDDFHPDKNVNCLEILNDLISRYKKQNIIINMFVPPCYHGTPMSDDREWCSKVRKHILSGNLCLAVHGRIHSQEEFKNLTYQESYMSLLNAEEEFKKSQLPFKKIFRGPHWGIGTASIGALIARRYTHLYSHTSYQKFNDSYSHEISIVYYNWNLKDRFGVYENTWSDFIVAHGHTSNVCGNGIEESYNRIVEALDNNEFDFYSLDKTKVTI